MHVILSREEVESPMLMPRTGIWEGVVNTIRSRSFMSEIKSPQKLAIRGNVKYRRDFEPLDIRAKKLHQPRKMGIFRSAALTGLHGRLTQVQPPRRCLGRSSEYHSEKNC